MNDDIEKGIRDAIEDIEAYIRWPDEKWHLDVAIASLRSMLPPDTKPEEKT